jgi:hypothetical protein
MTSYITEIFSIFYIFTYNTHFVYKIRYIPPFRLKIIKHFQIESINNFHKTNFFLNKNIQWKRDRFAAYRDFFT